MGGSHELENLITLCHECHARIHKRDHDECLQAGPGPTIVGSSFESLPGPAGPAAARILDAIVTVILVTLGALVLGLVFPQRSLTGTLWPVFSVLDGLRTGDTVVLSWISSAVIIQLLLSVQPLVRRLSAESIPHPPAGTWRQWSSIGLGLMVLGLVGIVVGPPRLKIVGFLQPLDYWVAIYLLGTVSLAPVLSMAVFDASSAESSRTTLWRYLSVMLSCSVVALLSSLGALLLPTVPLLGLSAPIVAGLLLIILAG